MAFNVSIYQARRQQLAGLIGDGVAVIPTAPERVRNSDSHYSYRWDSHFYYLTGFTEPEAVAVISPSRSILFCREKNAEREIWDGFRYGPQAAASHFAFDEAYPIDELAARLPDLMADCDKVYTPIGLDAAWDQRIVATLESVRGKARAGISAPNAIVEGRSLIGEMRLIKDAHEIAMLRTAGEISAEAHVRAMQRSRPGMMEYEVQAEIEYWFLKRGALYPAYGSIVASGANACCLHYHENNRQMQDGDLLLIDAGGEFASYAADITRTFPVNGRFSAAQRDVYEVVLAAQEASIAAVRAGRAFNEYHDVATKVLAQGLIDLGLCQGSLDAVLETKAYFQFYMHRAGHWLGLDVHDAGNYKEAGEWRNLAPGMVLTVEPGLYIQPAANVPEAFWHIGIRIEDDILVTDSGNENLTHLVPKTVNAIEALMAEKSHA